MEPRPASPCAEHTLRQGLLISALFLTFWNPLTTAQLTIESVPRHAVEGQNLLLQVHNLPDNLYGYFWFKGETGNSNQIVRFVTATNTAVPGPANTGRETIQPNGSLLIVNVTMKDTGVYIFQTLNMNLTSEDTPVEIQVYEPVTEPSLKATNTTVPEWGSVTFTCLSNDTEISIQWIFNNQNLPSTPRVTLSSDNRSLSIDAVTREDAGDYQCEISNPVSSMKSNAVYLDVINAPEKPGLSPGAIAGIVVGVVAGVALIGALVYFLYFRKTGGGSDQNSLTEHTPSASNHSPGPSDNAPKKTDEVAYTVLNFSDQKVKQPTSAPVSPTSETIYSQVKK